MHHTWWSVGVYLKLHWGKYTLPRTGGSGVRPGILESGHTLDLPLIWSVLCHWCQVTHPEILPGPFHLSARVGGKSVLVERKPMRGMAQVMFTYLRQVRKGSDKPVQSTP